VAVRLVRVVILLAFAIFFFGPLLAMLDYSTRVRGGGRTLQAWRNLVENHDMFTGITTSLLLALFSVLLMLALLVPTMIWVRLKVPGATRLVEFLCLLPLTIPALVIVVGLTNVYAWVTYIFGDSALTLTFIYVVLVLPFAYRAIDAALSAIDVTTLAEAARSLGASWFTVIARIIVPNIWSGLLAAAVLSVSMVIGEYTIASLLNYQNLQVVIVAINKASGPTSVAASLATLLLGFVLLLAISWFGRSRRGGKTTIEDSTIEPPIGQPAPVPGGTP
jgi:putative spermidine/putrescine transport system permease protein